VFRFRYINIYVLMRLTDVGLMSCFCCKFCNSHFGIYMKDVSKLRNLSRFSSKTKQLWWCHTERNINAFSTHPDFFMVNIFIQQNKGQFADFFLESILLDKPTRL
jgi:hypothetical protein